MDGERVILTELERTVSLVCFSNRSEDDAAELVWLRNGQTVALREGNRQGQSGVCIMPVIHQDNGATFTCRLRSNASVEASVTLNVTCKRRQKVRSADLRQSQTNLHMSEKLLLIEEKKKTFTPVL